MPYGASTKMLLLLAGSLPTHIDAVTRLFSVYAWQMAPGSWHSVTPALRLPRQILVRI